MAVRFTSIWLVLLPAASAAVATAPTPDRTAPVLAPPPLARAAGGDSVRLGSALPGAREVTFTAEGSLDFGPATRLRAQGLVLTVDTGTVVRVRAGARLVLRAVSTTPALAFATVQPSGPGRWVRCVTQGRAVTLTGAADGAPLMITPGRDGLVQCAAQYHP